MRVLCLFFPRLSIQLALQQRPDLAGRALAMIAGSGDEALVSAASTEASARGAIAGLTPGRARSRCPGAAFLPDNAGACLDELERIASIIRTRATGIVAIVSREELLVDLDSLPAHVGSDDFEAATRLSALVRMWTGLNVRAGVANSRAEARAAARGARLAPAVRPPVLAWGEPPLQASSTGPLAVEVLIPLGTSPLAARARLLRATHQLQALLDGAAQSYREVRVAIRGEDGAESHFRRLIEPTSDVQRALLAAALVLGDQSLASASSVRLELGRLGPDIRVAPATAASLAREPLLRAG
ncbi:MAG: hypothetical protein WD557_07615 [Dehalococcoidia bacterium]